MQSYVNEAFLAKRSKYAKYGMYVGFGALFIGLMVTNRNPLVAYLFLLVGLIGATFGSYMSNRYVREPRADQLLDDALAPLDKRYSAYHYSLACNHLLLSHYGLTVIEPQHQEGRIGYSDGRWQHKAGWRKALQLFGEPSLGKPDQELRRDIEWVEGWVKEILPDEDIPVNGVIVFTNERATLEVSGEHPAMMLAGDLARYLKEALKGQPTLATSRLKELRRLLDEVAQES